MSTSHSGGDLAALKAEFVERWHEGDLTSDELFDEFAHRLAETIRNSKELRDLTDDHMGDCNAAADLIDPEVN